MAVFALVVVVATDDDEQPAAANRASIVVVSGVIVLRSLAHWLAFRWCFLLRFSFWFAFRAKTGGRCLFLDICVPTIYYFLRLEKYFLKHFPRWFSFSNFFSKAPFSALWPSPPWKFPIPKFIFLWNSVKPLFPHHRWKQLLVFLLTLASSSLTWPTKLAAHP